MESPQQAPGWASRALDGFFLRDRFSLTAGSIVCALLSLWLAGELNVPAIPGRAGCLLQQPAWPVAVGLAWLTIIGGAALASVIASRVHDDGGLFCACVGLAAISVRFGPARYALFAATSPTVYLTFAFEVVLLFAAVAIAWLMLRTWTHSGLLPAEMPTATDQPDEPLDQKLLATAAQAMITIVMMTLLSHSDAKAQALAAVAASSFVAALAANQFVPTQPSAWFWAGPMIVGLLGYISQYFSPWDWQIGGARGFFASLARPMPMDYASAGPAGALLGYWTSQRWHRNRHEGGSRKST